MKKLMCMTLAALLTMTLSMTTTYADKNGRGKSDEGLKKSIKIEKEDKSKEAQDADMKVSVEVTVTNNTDTNAQASVTDTVYGKKEHWKDNPAIQELSKQLRENHRDKEKRKELIRKIVKLRKEIKNDTIPVFIKGNELETDVPPVIKDGRTLIPVRAVTNSLGAEVGWSAETRTVTITKSVYGDTYGSKSISIQIKLDSDVVQVNGQEIKIDVPAQIISERTMVPLRFIAETFKQRVEWDAESGSVTIEDEEE